MGRVWWKEDTIENLSGHANTCPALHTTKVISLNRGTRERGREREWVSDLICI